MDEGLKRCPFCNGYAQFAYRAAPTPDNVRKVCARCSNCAAQTMWFDETDILTANPDKFTPMFPDEYKPYDGKAKAAEAWNRRTKED